MGGVHEEDAAQVLKLNCLPLGQGNCVKAADIGGEAP
jgi:hypothetical protein